ncbi:MAG: rhomboid family intramembrane serine protease [Anaerolineales bacterium]|nr:rhomboid family intramembrane serine protease [Anaerolineales bacterium]
MIPLRDSTPSRSVPVITWLIVAANTAVFLFQLMMDNAQLEWFINNFAFIPASWQSYPFWFVITLFTSMFMHGGWLHFISNMWILIIFGDNVEDRMGPVKYLVFYLLGGLAAGLMQFAVAPMSTIPTLGASGAIAGVMGAYIVLFPQARVDTLVPLIFFFRHVNVPAWIYLGFWFVTQLFSGVMALGQVAVGGVAWWAHIGGFAFGALGYRFFTKPRPKPEYEYPVYYQ